MAMRKIQLLSSGECPGYTLTELLVVLGTVALLSGVIAMTFSVITTTNRMNTDETIAMLQVHEAGRWITKDVQSADNVTGYSDVAWNCAMNCFKWTGTSVATVLVEYVIQDGVLLRKVNGDQGTQIAMHLADPGTNTLFSKSTSENNTYLLSVRAVYNGASISKAYKINKRIAEVSEP
jgi:type II secretory pathway pseudopilin PulG